MKTLSFSFILTCMMCMFYISCEEPKIQDGFLSNAEIQQRDIDDCSECPIDDCCCTIELDGSTTFAPLILCGVYNNTSPTNLCGTFPAPGTCPDVAGITSLIPLDFMSIPRDYFCLTGGNTFRIYNNSNDPVELKMTCRPDLTNPVYQFFTIPANSEVFFTSDGCNLEPCG